MLFFYLLRLSQYCADVLLLPTALGLQVSVPYASPPGSWQVRARPASQQPHSLFEQVLGVYSPQRCVSVLQNSCDASSERAAFQAVFGIVVLTVQSAVSGDRTCRQAEI
jgi:hypothetical protein